MSETTSFETGTGTRAVVGATRRTFLRGAGVTMALPWLESLAAGAPKPSSRRRAQAVRRAVHGMRRQPGPVVGQGLGRNDGAGPLP